MNIFALHEDPKISAEMMIDKHVIKMPTESCQMLHTNAMYFLYVEQYNTVPTLAELKAFHKEVQSTLMKPAMLNHPSTIWARETKGNWNWLMEHAIALCDEYTLRYGREHGSDSRIMETPEYPYPDDTSAITPVTIAMDDVYRLNEKDYYNCNPNASGWDFVIASYRHYYLEGKWRIAEWRNDRRPDWFPSNHFAKKHNVWVRAYNLSNPSKYPQIEISEELQ
tara:strand:- start:2158 stop:2826 length:669 start_codon:yes stop_codon:yes gene_type:complete